MRFAVVRMRRKGVPIAKEKLAGEPAVTGARGDRKQQLLTSAQVGEHSCLQVSPPT